MSVNPLETLRLGILAQLKKAQAELEPHYVALRERELLAKTEPTRKMCKSCGAPAHSPLKKCGDMSAGTKVTKDEESMKPLRQRETVPQNRSLPDKPNPGTVLPSDKKSKDLTPDGDGSGGDSKKGEKVAKADVPMAKPPGGNPTPAAPKASKPTAGGAPKAPGALAKQGPRLGAKDPMSQGMHQAAFAGAAKPQLPMAPAKGPKLTPEDQARRAATFAAFTPAANVGESNNQGAAGGASKPPVSGLELGRSPRMRSPILGRSTPR